MHLTDEQLRAVARSFTEQSIEAAAVNEAIALRARVAELEGELADARKWILAALKDTPQSECLTDQQLIAVLRAEIVRQTEDHYHGPWVDMEFTPTKIRIDGELDLKGLVVAVRAALLQTPDAEKGE